MSRFEVRRGMELDIAQMAGVMGLLLASASSVATEAKRLAGSERIAREIEPTVGIDALGPVGRVNANHWSSWFVEGGTATQTPRAFLRRALERPGRKVL